MTDVGAHELSVAEAVQTYRNEWLIERGFHRLKGVPLSLNPLFVKRDDQVVGMTHLLTLALRLLTLMEFVVRRRLQEGGEGLKGILPSNPKKGVERPTAERLLRAFQGITRTVVRMGVQEMVHVTPLTALQRRILELLEISVDVYG